MIDRPYTFSEFDYAGNPENINDLEPDNGSPFIDRQDAIDNYEYSDYKSGPWFRYVVFPLCGVSTMEQYNEWYEERLSEDRQKLGIYDDEDINGWNKFIHFMGFDSLATFSKRLPKYLMIVGGIVVIKGVRKLI